jgi:hypothetical protein
MEKYAALQILEVVVVPIIASANKSILQCLSYTSPRLLGFCFAVVARFD